MNAWTKCEDGTMVAEASDLRGHECPCPKCGAARQTWSLVGVDRSGEDIAGWRFRCGCGASLLIVND